MSTGFTFDFLKSKETDDQTDNVAESQEKSTETKIFGWLSLDVKVNEYLDTEISFDDIQISSNGDSLSRVRENHSTAPTLKNTDLVSGVYEGGLKVWECSLDLCRYIQEKNLSIGGHILELGCGHGLPACWALKKACREASTTEGLLGVCFSDFNKFVLQDVTIPNILLNTRLKAETLDDQTKYTSWLSHTVSLAYGDWNILSEQLCSNASNCPDTVPKDGRFDLILAAETTYSSSAAFDTAKLIATHLKAGTGIALIATKRYYFGVGGGSDSLKDALYSLSSPDLSFGIETLKIYDDGSSNIRELLKVSISKR